MLDISTIINLFKEPLYEVNSLATTTQQLQEQIIEEATKVVVLFTHQEKELPVEEYAFLAKILAAVSINIQEVKLLNIHYNSLATFTYIQSALQPSYLIGFGLQHHHIGLNIAISPYQLRHFRNCHLLLADTLANISVDNRQKRLLWGNLKKMFDVK